MSCFVDYSKMPYVDNYEDWCKLGLFFRIRTLGEMGVANPIRVSKDVNYVKKLFDEMNKTKENTND